MDLFCRLDDSFRDILYHYKAVSKKPIKKIIEEAILEYIENHPLPDNINVDVVVLSSESNVDIDKVFDEVLEVYNEFCAVYDSGKMTPLKAYKFNKKIRELVGSVKNNPKYKTHDIAKVAQVFIYDTSKGEPGAWDKLNKVSYTKR